MKVEIVRGSDGQFDPSKNDSKTIETETRKTGFSLGSKYNGQTNLNMQYTKSAKNGTSIVEDKFANNQGDLSCVVSAGTHYNIRLRQSLMNTNQRLRNLQGINSSYKSGKMSSNVNTFSAGEMQTNETDAHTKKSMNNLTGGRHTQQRKRSRFIRQAQIY